MNFVKTLKRYDEVKHARYGIGVVLEEWGTWCCCRNCYGELPSAHTRKCSHCGEEIEFPLQVSGKGVFEVRFKDQVRSINHVWLRRVQAEKEPAPPFAQLATRSKPRPAKHRGRWKTINGEKLWV